MSRGWDLELLPSDVIECNARLFPDRTAVVCEEERLTWQQLDEATAQVANALVASGLQRGDKVAQLMLNSIETFVAFWGILRAACCAVPLNTMLDDASLTRLANDSDARFVFADAVGQQRLDGIRDQLEPFEAGGYYTFSQVAPGWASAQMLFDASPTSPPESRPQPEDSMTILYTSGTTGIPKGIEHSHRSRVHMYSMNFATALRTDSRSVAVLATPAYASGTWICMLPVMYRGGKIVITRSWDPEGFLTAIERERGTHAFLVPTQCIGLLASPTLGDHDASSMQVVVSSGQSIAPVTKQRLEAAFPNAGVHEVYGFTEGFASVRTPQDEAAGKGDSVGLPLSLEDVRFVADDDHEVARGEEGELCVRGMGMMKGYYNNPELTEQATWVAPSGLRYVRSGDMGHIDEDGYIYVTGRKKDMIKSGGINIYAVDIEAVFMDHPAVRECAAVARRDDKWGETPVLAVIAASPELDPEQVRAWGNERLARYQRVAEVVVYDDFPRATYGKVSKLELRRQLDPGRVEA